MNQVGKKRKLDLTICEISRNKANRFVFHDFKNILAWFPEDILRIAWVYYDSDRWQLKKDLIKVKSLVDRERMHGMHRYLFHEIEGKDTQMAKFVNGLIQGDIHDFTNELENFMTMQEVAWAEMQKDCLAQQEKSDKKRAEIKATVPNRRFLESLTVKQLRELLPFQIYLNKSGRKNELINRLCAWKNN